MRGTNSSDSAFLKAASYAAAGKKELAIANYEKSTKLDPKNQNGIERLKKLKESQ